MDRAFNVLFLCTHNSARSIMAECILNREGKGKFQAFSAGSHPSGTIQPRALSLLRSLGFQTTGLRSKSWDEFAQEGAPALDFLFTVCDDAAQEVCPIWPAQPMTAHWGIPDPSRVQGNEAEQGFAYATAYRLLHHRIGIFTSFPAASLDRLTAAKRTALQEKLDEIGRTLSSHEEE